jgi:hypothetical protein
MSGRHVCDKLERCGTFFKLWIQHWTKIKYINSWRMPTVYVLPFSISLLYQPDDDPSVGLKHVAFIKQFNTIN